MRIFAILAKFLRFLIFVLAVAAIALVIALNQIDPDDYKKDIETSLASVLARPVVITGKLSWKLSSLEPGIGISGLRIKNRRWAKDEDFVAADDVMATLSLKELLHGRLVIDAITIRNPTVSLEISPRGANNWSIGQASSPDKDKKDGLAISIERINIVGAEIAYMDKKRGNNLALAVGKASFTIGADGGIRLRVSASFDGHPISADLTGRREDENRNLRLSGWVNMYDAQVELAGKITDYMNPSLYTASIRAHIPDLSKMPGVESQFDKEAAVEINLVSDGAFVDIARLEASYDTFDISGTAKIGLGAKPAVIAKLKVPLFDIPNLFYPGWEFAYRERVRLGLEKADEPEEHIDDPKAFRGAPLPVAELDWLDARLDLEVEKLKAMPDMPIENIRLSAVLADGVGVVDSLRFDYMDGQVLVRSYVDNKSGKFDGEFQIAADKVSVGRIVDSTGYEGVFKGGDSDVDVILHGRGADLAEFMAGLEGYIKSYTVSKMTGYRIEKLFMAQDLITSILKTLIRNNKKNSEISCAVVNLPVVGGKAVSDRSLAVETTDANIIVDGIVDFTAEKMDVSMATMDKDRLKVSGTITDLVKIEGSIAEPQIKINRDRVANKITSVGTLAVVAGVFTGGIGFAAAGIGVLGDAWLSSWESDPHPCMTAFDGAADSRISERFSDQSRIRKDFETKVSRERTLLEAALSAKMARPKSRPLRDNK
ncbi:MAG: AsmA family protein [Rickettsiales bacterium]|jgi:uncharacterized protein involved in outer membrane biogenesis|nr:AsmA family protein [Rickettsiales bacterium]